MAEYRVAELARAADTSVRNVRVYQDRGLLPPPRRVGRIGLYNDEHLSRLRLIGQLLSRGYTFATIGELFDAWSQGQDLAETLGLRAALGPPAMLEQPASLTRAEVAARFGGRISAESLSRAVNLGVLVPDGTEYLVPSPSLLAACAELVASGIPAGVVLNLAASVQADVNRVARSFVALFRPSPNQNGPAAPETEPNLAQPDAALVAQQVIRLRPHAQRTVDALLLLAMQRETDRLLGRPSALPNPADTDHDD